MSRTALALLLAASLHGASAKRLVVQVSSAPNALGSIAVAWDAPPPAQIPDGYIVEYDIPGSGLVSRVDVGFVLLYQINGLKLGTVYEIRVYAYVRTLSDPSGTVASPPAVPPPAFVCAPLADPLASPVVSIIINSFDATVKRSDPLGMLVRFDAGSSDPITRIELSLEGNGEPAVPLVFPVGVGFDGRFVRAIAFKPTINGTFPLVVKAEDSSGRHNAVRCLPGVTVMF